MKRTEKECPECHKKFYCPIAGAWAHKRRFFDGHLQYFCTNTCLEKYAAKMDKEKKKRKAERVKRMMKRGNVTCYQEKGEQR